ncbi:MAG TPA: D-glucuronyl C5-epimerase family protein [Bacteroidales bacterium]|nr:D-glucuronyl C5-epimerase family protein [Bacteroidales bacterium]
MRKEPIYVQTNLWNQRGLDTLGYYYLEHKNIPSVHSLLQSTEDSLFVMNTLQRHKNTVTLKNSQNPIAHFTNNYSSATVHTYSYYLETTNSVYLKIFWKNVIWMANHLENINDSTAVWKNDNLIYDKYNLFYGWPSAYSQGFGISALSRAFQETQDSTYLHLAEEAMNAFNVPLTQGGVLLKKKGEYWYLEYPGSPPGFVLNGMIFGILGIYDYYRITHSSKALCYFTRGIQTLKHNLYLYDMGYWSRYDLLYFGFCAGYNYHKNVHIPQLHVLFEITGDDVFDTYTKRFQDYLSEPSLTWFKINFTLDALQRRLTYKNPLKHFTKDRFE